MRAATELNFLSAKKFKGLFFHKCDKRLGKVSGSPVSSSPEKGIESEKEDRRDQVSGLAEITLSVEHIAK